MMPMISVMSLTATTRPEVNISLSTWTSLVTRVISRPTGLRSKNAGESFCSREKICSRRVKMTRWPVRLVR